jgi:hypothetical protein
MIVGNIDLNGGKEGMDVFALLRKLLATTLT